MVSEQTINSAAFDYYGHLGKVKRSVDEHYADRVTLKKVADIACLPWIYRHERQGQKLEDFPRLQCWYQILMSRQPVIKGLAVASDLRDDSAFTSDSGREVLFGRDSDPGTRH